MTVTCPVCGEESEIDLDLAEGEEQEFVQDCPVCCRPWRVRVTIQAGVPQVSVSDE